MTSLAPRLFDAATGGATSEEDFAAFAAGADEWLSAQGIEDERVAFVPRADVPSLALLAACFARGTPVVPLHARATEAERAALLSGLGGARTLDARAATRAPARAWAVSSEERPLAPGRSWAKSGRSSSCPHRGPPATRRA